MGYRAHTVTQQREYGDVVFGDWETFTNHFVPAMREQGVDINGSDAEDYFEVYKEDVQDFINRRPSDDEESLYPGVTNKELKAALQTSIDESPDETIAWEWF